MITDTVQPTSHTHDLGDITWEHMPTSNPDTTMLGASGHFLTITTDGSPADGPQGWLWSVDSPAHGTVVDRRPAPDMVDALRMASQVISAAYRPLPGGPLGLTGQAFGVPVRWIGGSRLDTAVVGWLVSWGPRPAGHGYEHDAHELVATYRGQTWVYYIEWLRDGCRYHLRTPDGADLILPNVASQEEVLVHATQMVTATPRPQPSALLSKRCKSNGVPILYTGLPVDTAVVAWSVQWDREPGTSSDRHWADRWTCRARGRRWTLSALRDGDTVNHYLAGWAHLETVQLPVSGSLDRALVTATQVATAAPRGERAPAPGPVADVDPDPVADDAPAVLPDHVLGELDTVTDEIVAIVLELVNGFTPAGERIDWQDIWDRLDRYKLDDGRGIDCGDSLISPALEAIKRRVRAARRAS